jgi:pyruvate/2-oxoglutarate dehydrogenase complex dihydrolipoamide acyltransferase (E2) component
MTRSDRTRLGSQRSGFSKTAVVASVFAAAGLVGLWYFALPSLADSTISMQRKLLESGLGPDATKDQIRAIMKNVDQLDADDSRKVREALFGDLRGMQQQSISRYFETPEADRPAVLDADIARMQLLGKLFEAVNPGSMRLPTESERQQWEERRKAREEGREQPREDRRRDDGPQIDREQAEEYMTALRARAEEQGVDLGRMGGFGRRGRRG